MSIKVEKTDNKNELKLEFTVAAEKFEDAMKKVYFQTAKYFNIPGFRKGKAPMKIVEKYYGEKDDKQQWFDKIKELAGEMGYAKEVKEFKENPDKYKAHVGDVSTVLRVALTGRTNTPDMYEIMQVLGKESIIKRFEKAKEQL